MFLAQESDRESAAIPRAPKSHETIQRKNIRPLQWAVFDSSGVRYDSVINLHSEMPSSFSPATADMIGNQISVLIMDFVFDAFQRVPQREPVSAAGTICRHSTPPWGNTFRNALTCS